MIFNDSFVLGKGTFITDALKSRVWESAADANPCERRLEITPQTLRNHLHHINQKLRTHNRLEAVTHALQRKLI